MLYVIIIFTISVGFRFDCISSLTFGSVIPRLTRKCLSENDFESIGICVAGKVENRITDERQSTQHNVFHKMIVWRNWVNPFFCGAKALQLYLALLFSKGVDVNDRESFLFSSDPAFFKVLESEEPPSEKLKVQSGMQYLFQKCYFNKDQRSQSKLVAQ